MSSPVNSQVRIIAGDWRGRKVPVPDIAGLRPTSDRIRETLFNWLSDKCRGGNVLDCFAGSGALGFEAASRGAELVSMVEQNQSAWRNLQKQIQRFDSRKIELHNSDIIELISQLANQYDIVFIDPPYAKPQLRDRVIDELVKHHRFSEGALIYLEWPVGETYKLPAGGFIWLKQKKAGRVHYAIAEWQGSR